MLQDECHSIKNNERSRTLNLVLLSLHLNIRSHVVFDCGATTSMLCDRDSLARKFNLCALFQILHARCALFAKRSICCKAIFRRICISFVPTYWQVLRQTQNPQPLLPYAWHQFSNYNFRRPEFPHIFPTEFNILQCRKTFFLSFENIKLNYKHMIQLSLQLSNCLWKTTSLFCSPFLLWDFPFWFFFQNCWSPKINNNCS